MSDNALKTHQSISLDGLARGRAVDFGQLLGKGVPCSITKIISSNMVQIKFEIKGPYTLPEIVVPVSSPEFARVPHQVGDKGVVSSIDYYQGGISGQGGGTADYAQRGNLTNLRFTGIGNTKLPLGNNVDLNAYTIYGKNGVVLHDLDSEGNIKSKVTISSAKIVIDITNSTDKTVEIKGSQTITFDGDLRVKGNITAGFEGANVTLLNHTHSQPDDSHGDAEAETNAPTPGH